MPQNNCNMNRPTPTDFRTPPSNEMVSVKSDKSIVLVDSDSWRNKPYANPTFLLALTNRYMSSLHLFSQYLRKGRRLLKRTCFASSFQLRRKGQKVRRLASSLWKLAVCD